LNIVFPDCLFSTITNIYQNPGNKRIFRGYRVSITVSFAFALYVQIERNFIVMKIYTVSSRVDNSLVGWRDINDNIDICHVLFFPCLLVSNNIYSTTFKHISIPIIADVRTQ
jgi:hypothetical protein